jgi:hypothetical protein
MARDFDDVRITFSGNVELARQYVSEARKYLGGLKDANNTNSAYRHITNSDGVRFFVANYVGQKQIEIWAPGGETDEKSKLFVIQGYMLAPRTLASITAYSINPYTISSPAPGNAAPWKTYFYTNPGALTPSTHPTNAFVDTFKTYETAFSNATAAGNSFSSLVFNSMSWNNADEDLFVYWSNLNYINSGSFNNLGTVYINGSSVFNISTYLTEYTSRRLTGISAVRTGTGLTVYGTAACFSSGAGSNIVLFRATLVPTTAEVTRLAKLEKSLAPGEKLQGYANAYVVSEAPVILKVHSISNSYNTYSAYVFNQSANECRGIHTVTVSNVLTVYETVFDLRPYLISGNALDITVTQTAIATGTGTQTNVKNYDSTSVDARTSDVRIQLGWDPYVMPDIDTTYSYTESTAPIVEYSYKTYGTGSTYDVCNGYTQDTADTFTVSWFKAFVDYINDAPVYGYIKPLTKQRNDTSQILNYPTASETITAVMNLTSYATGTGVPNVVSTYRSNTKTHVRNPSNVSITTDRADEAFALRCDYYDENGAFAGYWTDLVYVTEEKRRRTVTSSYSSTKLTVTQDTTGTYPNPWDGNSFNASYSENVSAPLVDNYTATKTIAVHHINLRTKSLALTVTTSKTSNLNSTACSGSVSITGVGTATIPYVTTSQTTTETKRQTFIMHAGTTVFLSSEVVSASSTPSPTVTNSTVSFQSLSGIQTQYMSAASLVPQFSRVVSADAAALDAYATANTQPTLEPTYPYTHGTIGLSPADISTSVARSPFSNIVSPTVSSWPGLNSEPSNTEAMATRVNSYVINGSYYTGINTRAPIRLTSHNVIGFAGTIDYITGAHTSPFFTSPFNISAIADAVKKA